MSILVSLKETDLSEIEYELEEGRIRVARNITQQGVTPTPVNVPTQVMQQDAPTAKAETSSDPASHPGTIKAPMVGTAYLSPQPDAAPFIKEGSSITEGDTLLILEAMKVMNPIKAPKSGKILKIFVQDAAPVEFGEPLVIIE